MRVEQLEALRPITPPRNPKVRLRSVRRPFSPSETVGPYRLPKALHERLAASLVPFRNREAAYALAVFLARYWSAPGRIEAAFPIDRRALAERAASLDLTEAQVRGAIRVLEEVGFLARDIPPSGSRYKATAEGLHRRPILFRFGSEYAPVFIAANKRSQAARERLGRAGRSQGRARAPLPCGAILAASVANSPKDKAPLVKGVIMGDVASGYPGMSEGSVEGPMTGLEAALQRLGAALTS